MKKLLLLVPLISGCGNGQVDTKSRQVICASEVTDHGNVYTVNQPSSYRSDWKFLSTNTYKIGDEILFTTRN